MSFDVYVSAFKDEDSVWLPLADIRRRFLDHIVREEHDTWYLAFGDESLPLSDLFFEPKGDRIDGRLDRKGAHVNNRLDRKGNRINERLDRRATHVGNRARRRG